MRNLDPTFAAGLSAPTAIYALFGIFTFASDVRAVWTGPGNYAFPAGTLTAMTTSVPVLGAQTGTVWTGIGSMGEVGALMEGSDGKAEGITVTLSGVDPAWLGEAMTDIQIGAGAWIWIALLNSDMSPIGVPYLWFAGTVDAPSVPVGPDAIQISLRLENQLVNHERPNALKYTSADQALVQAGDSGFDWVEQLNDQALLWG